MENELTGTSSDARLRTLERRIRHLRVLRSAKSQGVETPNGGRRGAHAYRPDMKGA